MKGFQYQNEQLLNLFLDFIAYCCIMMKHGSHILYSFSNLVSMPYYSSFRRNITPEFPLKPFLEVAQTKPMIKLFQQILCAEISFQRAKNCK